MESSNPNPTVREFFDRCERLDTWRQDFDGLRYMAFNLTSRMGRASAKSEENRYLNRYQDVLPFDESRVCLQSGRRDYINASHVRPPFVDHRYICSQGPLDHTTSDFWRMVWDESSSLVVMLNRIIEKGRLKCHPYWPTGLIDSDGDVDDQFHSYDGAFTVRFLSRTDNDFYVTSQLELVNNELSQSRTITHLHYNAWPDFGVPESPFKFLNFLKAVRQFAELSEGAPVVHCSAGIGRTGTLVLIDTILTIMAERRTEHIDVYSILLSIRQDRFGLVQTHDQLRFSFLSILEGMAELGDRSGWGVERVVAEVSEMVSSSEASESDEYLDSEDEDEDDEVMLNGVPISSPEFGVTGGTFSASDDDEDELEEDGLRRIESIELLEGSPPAATPELLIPGSISPVSGLSEEMEELGAGDVLPTAAALVEKKEEDEEREEEERRRRKERTAGLVSDMKERLQAHEQGKEKRERLWANFGKPLLFGSAAALGLSILIYLVK